MKEIDDDALEECFFRIAVGETLSVVANKFGLTTSGVARRVSKMLRILNHPDNCLEDEPQPYLRYPDYGMGIPEWIREKKGHLFGPPEKTARVKESGSRHTHPH